jgi:nucleotide-binding universal stress UspA family protein
MTPTFKSILMATDFGPEAATALRLCALLARQLGASIHLLHVARDPMVGVSNPELYGIDWARLRDDVVTNASKSLAALVATCPDAPIMTEVAVGSPAETIVHAAHDLNADLIVMGHKERRGLGSMLIGSVAERVIRVAPCSVMTVRPSGATRVISGGAAVAAHEPVVA